MQIVTVKWINQYVPWFGSCSHAGLGPVAAFLHDYNNNNYINELNWLTASIDVQVNSYVLLLCVISHL